MHKKVWRYSRHLPFQKSGVISPDIFREIAFYVRRRTQTNARVMTLALLTQQIRAKREKQTCQSQGKTLILVKVVLTFQWDYGSPAAFGYGSSNRCVYAICKVLWLVSQ